MNKMLFSKNLLKTLLLCLTMAGFVACNKDLSNETPVNNTGSADLTTTVSTSVNGYVIDENNHAVMGAMVKAGTATTVTDKYGYFSFSHVQLVQNAAFVTVTKTGYFNNIKTFTASANKTATYRFKLIPKTNVGAISGTAGGQTTLTNGLSIKLPANAVVNAATNAAYSGSIHVAAYWISPTASDLNMIMPGNLRGLNTDNQLKNLLTYGMAAVELTGDGGELLQMASGKNATLSFPIPSSLQAAAPATIPLWYFDETIGLWKQQGSATKLGNTYVGDVSHFSYWNCDFPFADGVHFDATLIDANGAPLQNVEVEVTLSNGQYTGCHGMTDSLGHISGTIPANAQLIFEFYSYSFACYNTPLATQNVTTTNVDINLGNITITGPNVISFNGTLNNCSGAPVTNGYIIVANGFQYIRYPVSSNGTFNFDYLSCSGNGSTITIIGEDVTAMQEGVINNYTILNGANNLGTISACGTNTQQFINYSINGTSYSFVAPADSIYQFYNQTAPPLTSDGVGGFSLNAGTYSSADISFTGTSIGLGSGQNLSSFYCSQITDSLVNPGTGIPVNITEYGSVGQFVAGNFSGTVVGAPPTNTTYAIVASFRYRRRY